MQPLAGRLLAAVLALGLAAPSLVLAQGDVPAPVVVAQGESVVSLPADRAWLTFAVEVRHDQATEARARAAADMTAVRDALRSAGVSDEAMQTMSVSLSPEVNYDDGRGEIRGYVARHRIEVRIDDLDRLAAVIDAAGPRRGAGLSIEGPRFGLRDEEGARRTALRQAVEAARGRAMAIADGAGRQLGAILRIEEQSQGLPSPRPEMMMMRAAPADAMPTPITPGDIEVRAAVILTVELR